VKPEESHIGWVVQGMLRAANALKVFVIEPVDVRMGIAWVTGSAIDIPSVHRPEVGDNINVGFRDIRGDICIENPRNKLGLHYVS
jgi:hypothetical protein